MFLHLDFVTFNSDKAMQMQTMKTARHYRPTYYKSANKSLFIVGS